MSLSQNFPSSRPSLLLDFANAKALDPRVTFTRASSATFTGSNGLIQSAPANTPRFDYDPVTLAAKGLLIEEQRTNLLTYSQNFDNSIWVKTNVLVTPNAATAPDGSSSAETVTVTSTSNPIIYETYTSTVGSTYCFSFWIKAINNTQARIELYNNAVGLPTFVSSGIVCGPGSIQSSSSAAITGLSTTQWTRVFVVATAVGTILAATIKPQGATVTVGDSYLIWGAQLEAGSFPTSYIPSTNTFTGRSSTGTFIGSNGLIQTASSGVARYQYNPLDLSIPPFLLLEAAATNLLTWNEDFTNAAWAKTNSTATANASTAPDGTSTADKIAEDATTNPHQFSNSPTLSLSTTYTLSIYAKAAERSWIILNIFTGVASCWTWFNVSAGTVGTIGSGATARIDAVGNGWFRCSITATTAASGSPNVAFWVANADGSINYAGTAGSGILVWGAQLEAGSFATSYIPTTTAAVTRAADTSTSAQTTRSADVASMTGAAFSNWYNSAEGTLYTEFTSYALAADARAVTISNGTSGNRLLTWGTSGLSRIIFEARLGAVDQASIQSVGTYAANAVTKTAGAYRTNDFALSVNAGAALTDTSGTVPAANRLDFGAENGGGLPINGCIRRFTYYPVRLSNANLQALTS